MKENVQKYVLKCTTCGELLQIFLPTKESMKETGALFLHGPNSERRNPSFQADLIAKKTIHEGHGVCRVERVEPKIYARECHQ